MWGLEVVGAERVPSQGAYVVAPVHRSNIDTLVVAGVARRRLRYMGKDTLWSWRWSAWLLSSLGGFPIHRGTADREALRRCRLVLEAGEPLVMFPEGQRGEGPVVGSLYEGAAYLSGRAGVPIVPVGIGGSGRAMARGARLPRRSKVVLVIGDPLAPPTGAGGRPSRSAVMAKSRELHERLQELFDEAERLAAAG